MPQSKITEKNPLEWPRKEATPVEIAALLMDAVCTPAKREQAALGELAGHLGIDLSHLQSELMFLRAFAGDFATAMALAQEVDAGLIEEMQDRLALYGEEVGLSVGCAAGLSGLVGRVFAQCCQGGVQGDVRGVF